MLTVKSCVATGLTQLMMNLDRRYALYIQKLYHRSHFTVGGCGTSLVLTIASLQRLKMEALISTPADREV